MYGSACIAWYCLASRQFMGVMRVDDSPLPPRAATLSRLPCNSWPLICFMAARTEASWWYSQNPNPLCLPVCLSVISLQQSQGNWLTSLARLCLAAEKWHCQGTGRKFGLLQQLSQQHCCHAGLTLVCCPLVSGHEAPRARHTSSRSHIVGVLGNTSRQVQAMRLYLNCRT